MKCPEKIQWKRWVGETTQGRWNVIVYLEKDMSLYEPIRSGQTEIVRQMLTDVNVDISGATGYVALFIAAQNGYTEIVKLLLDAGVDLNVEDDFGESALLKPAFNGCTEIVKLLIGAGINVKATDINNENALMHATENGHTGICPWHETDIKVLITNNKKALEGFS